VSKIQKIHAREILDSRGNPTIEVELATKNYSAIAAAPSGASTGTAEAVELRDHDNRFNGRGVQKAVKNVNEILACELKNFDVTEQKILDQKMCELDGTSNKAKLGANAILAISLATAKIAAQENSQELFEYFSELANQYQLKQPKTKNQLPVPLMNILNGGEHADNGLAIQEFMIVPTGFNQFSEALRAGVETFHTLKKILQNTGNSTNVGDEGGFAPNFSQTEEAITVILEAIKTAGYEGKIQLAMDAAASEFFKNGVYQIDGQEFDAEGLTDFYAKLKAKFPLISLEDGLAENDFAGWQILTERLKDQMQLVGDDLFCTNPERIKKGIEQGLANSLLVKLNQIGTVSETIEAVELSRSAGYSAIISHRSGETEDTTIADLAVGLNVGQIKTGAPSRTDRVCKYNRLLRIEEKLGAKAKFGWNLDF
jgi:enolase